MRRPFEQFSDEDKGKLVKAFERENPRCWQVLQSRPDDIDRAMEVLAHTQQTIEELQLEHAETRQDKIGREAIKVFQERSGNAHELSGPVVSAVLSEGAILEEARNRIAIREEAELEAIRVNGNRAVEIIADISEDREELNMSEIEKEGHFKADLHKAVDDAQKSRNQARRLFVQERDQLLEEASAIGSEAPEKDVSKAYGQTMRDIDRQEHKDIHAVFEDYGWERGKKTVEFHEVEGVPETREDKQKLYDHVRKVVDENTQGNTEIIPAEDRYRHALNDQDNDHEY